MILFAEHAPRQGSNAGRITGSPEPRVTAAKAVRSSKEAERPLDLRQKLRRNRRNWSAELGDFRKWWPGCGHDGQGGAGDQPEPHARPGRARFDRPGRP